MCFSNYLKIQCLAKSVASFAVQSAFDFSFKSAHHCSLPISAVHAEINIIRNMDAPSGDN